MTSPLQNPSETKIKKNKTFLLDDIIRVSLSLMLTDGSQGKGQMASDSLSGAWGSCQSNRKLSGMWVPGTQGEMNKNGKSSPKQLTIKSILSQSTAKPKKDKCEKPA